eukprot:gene9877-2066_t
MASTQLTAISKAIESWIDSYLAKDKLRDNEFSSQTLLEDIALSFFPKSHQHHIRCFLGENIPFVLVHETRSYDLKFNKGYFLHHLDSQTAVPPRLVPYETKHTPMQETFVCVTQTHGLNKQTARLVASALTISSMRILVPWVIQCTDNRQPFLVIFQKAMMQSINANTGGLSVYTISACEPQPSRELPLLSTLIDKLLAQRHYDGNNSVGVQPTVEICATYDLLGTISDVSKFAKKIVPQTYLHAEFIWQNSFTTSTNIAAPPPPTCPLRLRFRAYAEPNSCTSEMYAELGYLLHFCNIIEKLKCDDNGTVDEYWEKEYQGQRNLSENEFLQGKIETLLERKACENDGLIYSSRSGNSLTSADVRPLFTNSRQLDLPEQIWVIVKNAKTFAQLQKAVVTVFHALRSGELRGCVHPDSTTQIAQLVVACEKVNRRAARPTEHDKQHLNSLLATLATNPLSLLQCIAEVGAVKLQRDVLNSVVGQKLATERQLDPFLKLENSSTLQQTKSLRSVLRAIDAVVLVHKHLDLSTKCLADIMKCMLKTCISIPFDEVPEVMHALPEFTSGSSLLKKVCSAIDPSSWFVKISHPSSSSHLYQFFNRTIGIPYVPADDDLDDFETSTSSNHGEFNDKTSLIESTSTQSSYHMIQAVGCTLSW